MFYICNIIIEGDTMTHYLKALIARRDSIRTALMFRSTGLTTSEISLLLSEEKRFNKLIKEEK